MLANPLGQRCALRDSATAVLETRRSFAAERFGTSLVWPGVTRVRHCRRTAWGREVAWDRIERVRRILFRRFRPRKVRTGNRAAECAQASDRLDPELVRAISFASLVLFVVLEHLVLDVGPEFLQNLG